MILTVDFLSRLHSKEARERMPAYQIGKVEGVWSNFLPPIQGGKFRPYVEETCSSEEDSISQDSSSQEGSIPPSPIFDAVDAKSTIRRKKSCQGTDTTASTPVETEQQHKPAFLDARTREEIVFDTAKYPSLDQANQESIKRKYRELYVRMQADGLFDCNYFSL